MSIKFIENSFYFQQESDADYLPVDNRKQFEIKKHKESSYFVAPLNVDLLLKRSPDKTVITPRGGLFFFKLLSNGTDCPDISSYWAAIDVTKKKVVSIYYQMSLWNSDYRSRLSWQKQVIENFCKGESDA